MQKKKKKEDHVPEGVGAFVWEVVKIFAFAAIIIIPIRLFLFQPFLVQGASMAPNFHSGEYVIVNEVGYKHVHIGGMTLMPSRKELHRGDPVVFRFPQDPKTFFIKRIVGLPGERISVRGSVVTIFNDIYPDGFILKEEYLPGGMIVTMDDLEYNITNDEYFVVGDNRNYSHDSRAWGPLHKDFVMGKVLVRIWPFKTFRIFD